MISEREFLNRLDRCKTEGAKIARRLTRTRDDAEDLTQDAMVKVLGLWERYDPQRGSVQDLLNSAIRSLATDSVRRSRCRPVIASSEPDRAASVDDWSAVDARLLLETLDTTDRETLKALIEGLTQVEMSELWGVTPSGAEFRVQRLRGNARVLLAG